MAFLYSYLDFRINIVITMQCLHFCLLPPSVQKIDTEKLCKPFFFTPSMNDSGCECFTCGKMKCVPFPRLLRMLLFVQDAFSLLAYSDPWNCPVGQQLDPTQRESLCSALNSAILGRKESTHLYVLSLHSISLLSPACLSLKNVVK